MSSNFLNEIYENWVFSLHDSIKTNLLIAGIGRAVFLLAFLVNYFTLIYGKARMNEEFKSARKMSWKEWLWFIGKEIIFIFIGFVHVILAAAVATYSFMAAGMNFRDCGTRSKLKINHVLSMVVAIFLQYIVPILAIVATGYMTVLNTDENAVDYLVGVSIGAALYCTRVLVSLVVKHHQEQPTMERAMVALKTQVKKKLPRSVKVVLVCLLVVVPFVFFLVVDNFAGVRYWTESISTEDSVTLATDVYRLKSASKPQPVILIRTPYRKGSLYNEENEFIMDLLMNGYTVVYQDVRGRYASSGGFIPFKDERSDAIETIQWILAQQWCDGNITSFGGSALAINQYCYADEPTGAVKFQSITAGTPDVYESLVFTGGAFRKSLIETWGFTMYRDNTPRRENEYEKMVNWYNDHRLLNDSWDSMSLSLNNRFANVNTCALHVGGWYDIMSQGILDGFTGYNTKGGSGATGRQRLIMDPVGHGYFGALSPLFNGATTLIFPAANTSQHDNWENEMRDAVVKGTPINWNDSCVAYYLMGDVNDPNVNANKYKYSDQWPVPHVNRSFYMHGNHSLSEDVPLVNANHSFMYDPRNPVLTKGGNNLVDYAFLEEDALGLPIVDKKTGEMRTQQLVGIGPYDQAVAGNLDRDDVLVYKSPTLGIPFSAVGRMEVKLWIASNCTDTAFSAMVMDAYPNGSVYNILDGLSVMRFRDGLDHEAPSLSPGAPYQVTIDLWSTAYQFNAGHQIWLAISSSNYPRFERHPNNSDPLDNHPSNFNIANNSILTGGVYNSCLILPELIE
ncbi:CocE/NonD family hydrolase [Candidatus Bathyarchaeota archaeon]|nr:CocE/NonD family hydrolase [Candidatus Bathyarchaeota archaeon]